MYIKSVKKWRKDETGEFMTPYRYYRLCESYRDINGKTKQRMVLGLGELEDLSDQDIKTLSTLLTDMIVHKTSRLCDNRSLYEKALMFYQLYKDIKQKESVDIELKSALDLEARRLSDARKREMVTLNMKSLQVGDVRQIGAEHVCRSTLDNLHLNDFLLGKGFSQEQSNIALMQIIARSIYLYSELKTVSYLQENSALCEMFGIDSSRITKDVLYKSANRLYEIHRDLENWLHKRVCSMFNIEEKILLFDLTNTYFEGRMGGSALCQYGRSKEKRSDAKIVVLAAVVNTDGLLVRTEIFEGNRQDTTTLQEIIGFLEKDLFQTRRLVVMDAGFYSESNLQWLKDNAYDYITVMRSSGKTAYTSLSEVKTVTDNKQQQIRLQLVSMEGKSDRLLLVDSDAKRLKEQSMHSQLVKRYEEGLVTIQKGIEGRGIKQRDKVNARLGRLNEKYGSVHTNYEVSFEYDSKNKVISMSWRIKDNKREETNKFHGKYFLQTNLDEKDEKNIWCFYNVIRTVEETFKTLKLDLDIRPVYHKSDKGVKAHLNLAVLAYWVVSTTKYQLKEYKINVRWSELIRIMSTQVRVSMRAEKDNGNILHVRKSSEPEEKLCAIYDALGLSYKPICSVKYVWHLKPVFKKNDS
jgi:transposase